MVAYGEQVGKIEGVFRMESLAKDFYDISVVEGAFQLTGQDGFELVFIQQSAKEKVFFQIGFLQGNGVVF